MCLSAVTVARWRGPRRRPRQSPPLVHVRVYLSYRYSHSGEFISSRQSDDDTAVSPPLGLAPRGGAGGRGHSNRGSDRNRPSGAAERGGRRREGRSGEHGRGRRKKTRRQNARTLNEHFELCSCASPHAMRVSMPRSQHTVSLRRSRLARGQRLQDVTTPTRVGTAVGRGRVGTVGVVRSVGDGVSALQRCVTGCSRAQRCPAHMLKDMDPITGQMQSSQRHSRLARRLQYAEARRVSSRNGL